MQTSLSVSAIIFPQNSKRFKNGFVFDRPSARFMSFGDGTGNLFDFEDF